MNLGAICATIPIVIYAIFNHDFGLYRCVCVSLSLSLSVSCNHTWMCS